MAVACCIGSCTTIRMSIPESFQQQATMLHVKGAHGNNMSFDHFTTSKIKRGVHVSYPGWGRPFILENLWLNQLGIGKAGLVDNEKAKFRYALTDGNNMVQVYAHEKAVTRETEYHLLNKSGFPNSFTELQQYNYIFSAVISGDTTQVGKGWEMVMTNIYDRKASGDKNPFAYVKPGDNGLATNGTDTIFIKPVNIKQTANAEGKTSNLPFKLLSGYELSTTGGVIGIVDLMNQNIWFYKELDANERLNVAAIATAIFARRVHNENW